MRLFLQIMTMLTKTALSLHNKGVKIEAIIDIREKSNGDLVKKCIDLGLKIMWKHTVVSAAGHKRIKKVFCYETF